MGTCAWRTSRGRERGVATFLGLIALAALLAVWCSIVLSRSGDSHRAAAMLEWRLKARAAAEGVAVVLLENPASPPKAQALGEATVVCGAPTRAAGGAVLAPMEVVVRPAGTKSIRFTGHYLARCARARGGGWRLVSVEEKP